MKTPAPHGRFLFVEADGRAHLSGGPSRLNSNGPFIIARRARVRYAAPAGSQYRVVRKSFQCAG